MSKNNYYITTPVFYVNDIPHIGHAYTSIASDVIARYMRLSGKNVMFLTGTDEHGKKVEQAAKKLNLSNKDFTDKNSRSFSNMTKTLSISNDDFIRTTESRHKESVCSFWNKLESSGNIYQGTYSGWYSVSDEAYYSESEITESGLAPTGSPVEWVKEESYFFALSKWQNQLLEYYNSYPNFIQPKSRFNEIVRFVQRGLRDISISRTSLQWGVTVPSNKQHVVYVWLDALINYISVLGYPKRNKQFAAFWPASAHIIGKDILRFHAVYWPAFLMAAGVSLPKVIFAHGWWTNKGKKISKSLGNVIDPLKLINKYGLDPVRYFLMREISFGHDGNFSEKNLIVRNNSELANKIGNLLQRTSSIAHKYCNGRVPNVSDICINQIYASGAFKNMAYLIDKNHEYIESFSFNKILNNIIYISDQANISISNASPWLLVSSDPDQMKKILYSMLEISRYLGIILQPFIPHSASKMLDQMNVPLDQRSFCNLTQEFALKPGLLLQKPMPIFLKI